MENLEKYNNRSCLDSVLYPVKVMLKGDPTDYSCVQSAFRLCSRTTPVTLNVDALQFSDTLRSNARINKSNQFYSRVRNNILIPPLKIFEEKIKKKLALKTIFKPAFDLLSLFLKCLKQLLVWDRLPGYYFLI